MHIGELVAAVVATVLLPIGFLCIDYVMRFKFAAAEREEIFSQAGADCCVLSLGSTGAVYIDPHLRSVPGLSSPLTLAVILCVIFLLRVLCLKNVKSPADQYPSTILYGLISISLVTVVLSAGFLFGTS